MFRRALVIANPGTRSPGLGALEDALDKHAGSIERRVRSLEKADDVVQVAREELRDGWDVVVAAGGDGTVAGVAQAAGEARVPLLIVPMGTANMLATQLGAPGDVDGAIGLLTGEAVVRWIDGMEIAGRLHFLSAGVGVSAKTISDLSATGKRLFGLSSYVWTGIASTFTFKPALCTLSLDGRRTRLRVLDISVINAGFRSDPAVPGFPDIRADDGRLDVLVVWAPRVMEYVRHLEQALFGWHRVRPNVRWRAAVHEVKIESDEPLLVQADGDLIGETPVTITLVRRVVGVIVPPGSVPGSG